MRVAGRLVEPLIPIGLFSIKLDKSRSAELVTTLIEPRVSHYREQPALEIAVRLQFFKRTDRPEISLLHEVFGVGSIASQSHGKPVESIYVLECGFAEQEL